MPPAFNPVAVTPAVDEAELVPRLAAFDAEAWEFLFQRDFDRIYKFAYVRTGESAAAEDIAAEVFEEATRRIANFEFRGLPVSAWLFKVARNLIADHLTKKRRRPVVSIEREGIDAPVTLSDLESLADIARAMECLTKEQQEVIALRFITGCDLIETAAAVDKSVGAVKLLQHRALRAMKKRLEWRGGERDQQ
jgi:RNA polymerase sigma-70 factor (ECF subfamily)